MSSPLDTFSTEDDLNVLIVLTRGKSVVRIRREGREWVVEHLVDGWVETRTCHKVRWDTARTAASYVKAQPAQVLNLLHASRVLEVNT